MQKQRGDCPALIGDELVEHRFLVPGEFRETPLFITLRFFELLGAVSDQMIDIAPFKGVDFKALHMPNVIGRTDPKDVKELFFSFIKTPIDEF